MKARPFNLKQELAGQIAVLAVTGAPNSFHDIILDAAEKYNKICYISINKPYYSFLDYFSIHKINPKKFFFIDCITKTVIKQPKKSDNCLFVSSPAAFDEINESVQKTLQKKKFDLLIFDSLSSLLIYQQELFITRFMHGLTAMVKGFHNKAVFIVLEKDIGMELARNMGMLMSKTIYLV